MGFAPARLPDFGWMTWIGARRSSAFAIPRPAVTSYLPLLPEVGEAILRYLQKSRPKTSFREIFIRSSRTLSAIQSGSSLYTPIRRRIDAAGVPEGGKRGPHAFRHARAVSMIRASVSVEGDR